MAVEWTTQSEQQAGTANGDDVGANGGSVNPGGEALQITQPLQAQPAPLPTESPVTPPHAPAIHPHPASTPQAPAGHEHCPSCGALVSTDQRYCLACGIRRGDPRLPFMDAVVFMDAMKQPRDPQAAQPSTRGRRRVSPNAALIAGVGTLLLALGIGVLIGRSGGETSAPQQAAPIVIKGGGEEAKTASTGEAAIGGSASKGGKKAKKTVAPEKAAEPASEELLKPQNGVKLPPPTTAVGDKCKQGEAGCNEKGEFDGSFFGEE
jgi:hypothetical protein